MATTGSTPKFYANETDYPNREVKKIVLWVMKYLEVENLRCFVKIKHHSRGHAYQGRFYPNVHFQGGHIYKEPYAGAGYGEYVEVKPTVPRGFVHLIVCRIGKPGTYPCMNHVYDRKDFTRCVADRRLAGGTRCDHRARGNAPPSVQQEPAREAWTVQRSGDGVGGVPAPQGVGGNPEEGLDPRESLPPKKRTVQRRRRAVFAFLSKGAGQKPPAVEPRRHRARS